MTHTTEPTATPPADLPARHLPLDGAFNVRDLGGHRADDGRRTAWRRLWRADSLHALTPDARDALEAAGVRLVVDLRHEHERLAAPAPFDEHARVRTVHVPLFAGLAPTAAETAEAADPAEAPADLAALYVRALDRCGDALREVLELLAQDPGGGALFHCTAGKDRTGLVAMLALGALGVPDDDIVADYTLTAEHAAPLLARLREEAAARGPDALARLDRFLAVDEAALRAALAHLRERHGSVPGYLRAIGLPEDTLERLRTRLLDPSAG